MRNPGLMLIAISAAILLSMLICAQIAGLGGE